VIDESDSYHEKYDEPRISKILEILIFDELEKL
jgi:hypothetical protein